MATRQVLAELVSVFEHQSGCTVSIEAVGGVDAANRVLAGEAFDVVVLASDAIDKLISSGHLQTGSKLDLVRSGVAVCVRAGAPLPQIDTEDALKRVVLAARSVSYSTGPSGVALAKLFEHWGIADETVGRMMQAPPGVPVGTLVARGEVELGFQQLSELIHVEGITVVGPLPPAIQIITTFSAGIHASVLAGSAQAGRVHALLDYMRSPQAADAKRRQGMEPV